jgi:hypothetical protein
MSGESGTKTYRPVRPGSGRCRPYKLVAVDGTDVVGPTEVLLLKERGELGEAETWHRRAADTGEAADARPTSPVVILTSDNFRLSEPRNEVGGGRIHRLGEADDLDVATELRPGSGSRRTFPNVASQGNKKVA